MKGPRHVSGASPYRHSSLATGLVIPLSPQNRFLLEMDVNGGSPTLAAAARPGAPARYGKLTARKHGGVRCPGRPS